MIITRGIIKIELTTDEKNVLRKALEILGNVAVNVADNDSLNYVVDMMDMNIYDGIYGKINAIKNHVTLESRKRGKKNEKMF